MTDAEIIGLAWRYYKARRASTGIPTRDEVIAGYLVLAIRAGCVARSREIWDPYTRKLVWQNGTGTGRAKTAARPIFLGLAFDYFAAMVGNRERAAKLIDDAFVRGFQKRYVDDWWRPMPSEEERHFWTLVSTRPTSVNTADRKKRERSIKWYRKRGRVIEKA